MTRLSFGLLCAQSAALFCLEKTLFENATNATDLTVKMVLFGFDMDEELFSFNSEEELLAFYKEIVPLLNSRCFDLTKFFTNNENLKSLIPDKDLAPIKVLNFKTGKILQNILGMNGL